MSNLFDRANASSSDPRRRIEDIARQSQVPVNVLLALGERQGISSPDDMVEFAGEAAEAMGPEIQAGGNVRDLIRQAVGDDADAFLARVREVGDELYPDQMRSQREQQEAQRRETEPGFGGNIGRSFLAGVSEGVGSAVEGIGALADQPFALARQDEHYQPGLLARLGRSGGDYLRDRANDLRQGMSEGARSAIEASTPGGDFTKPSTWTLGEGASLYGYSLLAADVLGSFLPVVAASVLARRPVVGVGVGASQSAGAGAGEARGIIEEAFNERDENGESLLERESPYFRELLASGMDEEEALETTMNAGARIAALFNAPVGGFGGAATGAIIRGAVPGGVGSTGGPMRRALTRGAMSATEEGVQEAIEGIATRFGVETATGMDIDLTEDTFGDFVLGALGGGVVGGVSGAIPQRAPEDEGDAPLKGSPDPVPPSPLALPAPTDGGTIFQGGEGPAPDGGGPRMVQVQLAGEPSAWGAEIVGGTANTVTLQGEDGAIFDIPRADIESGAVQITPVEGAAARPGPDVPAAIEPDPSLTPQAQEPEREPGSDLDPEEEAQVRLQEVEDQAERLGWTPARLELRNQLRALIDATGRAEQTEKNEASKIVTRKDGTPFKDQASATRALGRLGFSMDTHDIVARDDGFVATPRIQQQEAEDAEILDEREAGGESIGGRGAVDPQTGEGSPQADQDAAADPMGSPDGADIPGNLAGSSGTGEPVSTLTPPPSTPQASQPATPAMDVDRAKTRRRETDAFLDAAQSRERAWEGEVEGRTVVVRGNRARVRINEDRAQDIITDTEGMSREDLASWIDYATARGQQVPPITPAAGGTPAQKTPVATPDTPSVSTAPFPSATDTTGAEGVVDDVQQNTQQEMPPAPEGARVRRGDQPDTERAAPDGQPSIASTPEGDANFAANRAALGKFKKGQRVQWVNDNFNPPLTFTGTVTRIDRRSGQGMVGILADGGVDGKGYEVSHHARMLTVAQEADQGGEATSSGNSGVVTVRDVYGDTHRVNQSALDSDRPMLRRLNSRGEPIEGALLARENIDTDGTAVAQTWADHQVIGGGRTADRPMKSEAALRQAIARRGQKIEDFDVRPVDGGFLAVRREIAQPGAMDGSSKPATGEQADGIQQGQQEEIDGSVSGSGDALAGGETGLPVQAELFEQSENSVLSHPKVFGDSQAAHSLRSKMFESLSRNDQGVILSEVVRSLNDDQVLGSVIQSIPVDVMNVLVGQKVSSDHLRSNPSMLTSRLSVSGDVSVSQPVIDFINQLVSAAEFGVTRSGAEQSGLRTKPSVVDPSRDGGTTSDAISGDFWHGDFLGVHGSVHINASPAQKEAENYEAISAKWKGLGLTLESPKGTERRGLDADGNEWSVTMPADYGRILRTKGADGDHVDFYMGPDPASDRVFVVDQKDAETGAFDEHKVMLGFVNQQQAQQAFLKAFSDGKGAARWGAVTPMSVAEFQAKLKDSGTWVKPMKMTQDAVRPTSHEQEPAASAAGQGEDGEAFGVESASDAATTTLEAVTADVRRQRAGERLSHIYAERNGRRYYLTSVSGNSDSATAEWRNTFPGVSIYATDRADGTSINGDSAALEAAMAAQVRPKQDAVDRFNAAKEMGDPADWWARAGRDNDGQEARDLLERAGIGFDLIGRPWSDIRPNDRNAILDAREDAEGTEGRAAPSSSQDGDGGFSAERVEGGFYPRAETDQGQRTFRDTLYQTRAEATAAAPDALRRWQEGRESSAASPSRPATATKIEDFGEKIGGARKDTWAGFTERMVEAENFDLAREPLSKTWPEPDYQKMIDGGADPWSVAFIRAARDTVPRKPSQSWKRARWVERVQIMRDFAKGVLDGSYSREDIEGRIENDKGLDAVSGAITLYETFGHGKSFRDLTFDRATYSVLNGTYFASGKTFWEVTQVQKANAFSNMPRVLARGETKAEALEAFGKVYAEMTKDGETKDQKKADRRAKFIIWSKRGKGADGYFVGVKIGSNYIPLRSGIEGTKEARRIVSEEADQLQEQLARMKDVPRERREKNLPRIGTDHRGGLDVTPEMFQDAFGFRGVEFGNYVESERRQRDLNEAYDALMDMAGIVGVPSQAISLNGTLGLAFGARGTGGRNAAAAHYEPGKIVINLTKAQGRGSLAHEWFHALDNYFARARVPMRGTYITDNAAAPVAADGSVHIEGIRPEVVRAFLEVKRAISLTGLKKRSSKLDRLRSKGYWGTGIEMHARAFESYVIAKLQDQSASNDYLANVVSGTAWAMQAELSGLGESYPYLTPSEIEIVRPAFDALFDTIETRQTERGTEMFSRFSSDGGQTEPVAVLSGDELGSWSDMLDLGKRAASWYRENLIGKTVTMGSTGWQVRFSRRGANKISGRKGEDLLRIVPALSGIIEAGRLVSSVPNRKADGVVAYHKVAARVTLAGEPKDVVVTLRETRDGHYHYDLSRDMDDDARFSRSSSPVVEAGARNGSGETEGLAELNISLLPETGNDFQVAPPLSDEALSDIAADITREIKASGLAGKVGVRLVRGLMDAAGVPIQGRQRGAQIDVNPDSGDGALGTLRHEIVHALRDAGLWGTPYGLFTRPEWQGLVRAARADTALLKKVEAAYPDLGSRAQLEEAIAEQYRRWAQNMDQRSGVDRAFGKIKAFIEAIANALRGKGFQSAARTFDMIATGQIGGRGPDSPDGPGGRMAESRDPRESLREWQREGRRNTDGFTDVSTRPEAAMLFTALERAKTPRAAELAADKWVRAMGRETGVEYLVAFDRMGGLISVGRGEQHSVGMSDQLAAALADGAAHYVTHNHPSNGGFSIQDLANVAMFDVDISAIGHREAVVSGRIGPAVQDTDVSRSPEGMGRFIAMVDGVVIKHLGEMLRRNEVTVEALNSAHSHIFDMVRHRHGIIDLRSNGSKIVARHGIDAEALMEATDERIRHVLQANHVRVLPFRDQIGDPPLGGAFDTGDRGSGAIILPAPGRERAERSGASLPAAAEGGLNEGQPRSPDGRFAGHAAKYSRQMLADDGPVTARKERGIIGHMLTDAMGGKSNTYNILALVPSEPLFQELGKNLMAARVYLRHKHALGAMRNQRQFDAAKLMDEWRGIFSMSFRGLLTDDPRNKRGKSVNEAMMGLMHDATIAGIDPAKPFAVRPRRANETEPVYKAYVDAKREAYDELRPRWDALPKKAQAIYEKVRDAYKEASETERQIIMDNVRSAMELNLKRARLRYEDDLRKIEEDGLEGEERAAAEAEAAERLAMVKKRDGYGRNARLASLRAMFEQNEVDAPYFPLLRHGSYYVTVKDENNKVVSFSKFESERAQIQEAARLRRANPGHTVKTGLLDSSGGRGPDVDPNFVADVENMIGQTVADPALMDAIWQRYLETLPDFSIRKSRLHRKGTPGYSQDAFRGYARQMFHSAHQLARLKYGMHMQQALDDAKREADAAEDPNRAMAVVNEMEKRHEWVMNPKVSAWSTWATGAAFVYYLGATPAAALVNISQTVVVGIPVLAAGFERGTIGSASRHLGRALREFGMGKGKVENAKSLKPDEKHAIQEAYRRGIIDKSQAHDLAGVAETGVEYSDIRARMMRPIAFLFHHAERLNREITFMAAYRMAKEAGMEGDAAIEKAGNLTWKSHFNYESDSRPRLQHNDFVRVATVFRNYQLNMLYRLFRDLHQSLKAKSEPERKEARAQLIGITGMMMMMAGVSGTWGYALITTLAGLFMPGGADDIEQEVKEALVNTLGRDMAGIILKGVPGHLSGINLSSRMGMPELWFRRPDRQQEGDDLYQYWAEQMLGAVPGMAQNAFRGINMALEGEVWRGVETASPKFVRDWMRSARYAQDGVTTYRGNPIVESVSPQEALTQALSFSPARISEQYQTNRWMWNTQGRITDRRSTILRRVGDDIRAGNPISDRSSRAIREFNSEFPQYAITTDTIRQSIRARARGERETVGGVRLNRRLDGTIRGETAPGIYSN